MVFFTDRSVSDMRLSPISTTARNSACLACGANDLRQVSEELIFVGIVLFIGAKFFETRTIFSVGFDKLDAAKISMKGPDDDNIVWIGHRYGSKIEAETVAAAIESRMKDDAA